ncbi:polysaccharide deacetylase family protein [Gammaproteobacteria bacterium]|nr:polysaccharide deacetylase family protein [Gammaproteobacteria bacterium]
MRDQPREWADVKLDRLTELLTTIQKNHLSITRIDHWQETGLGQVALSFDDGHVSDYDIVLPLLQAHDATATFFITSNFVGREGYLSWTQVKRLHEAGMEIGSHSLSHPYSTTISQEELMIEMQQSKFQIEQKIGAEVRSFAYPYGDYSQRTHQTAIAAGYKYICTSKPGLCKTNSVIMERNSIHSNTITQDIEKLLNPSRLYLLQQKFKYAIRHILKRSLGVKNYLKLKQLIYS